MIVYTNLHHLPFQIDAEDYLAVSYYRWYFGNYIQTTIPKYQEKNGQFEQVGYQTLLLHIFLLGKLSDGLRWDHIDRNRFNYQRSNFRQVTAAGNARNRSPNPDNFSNFTGVYWEFSVSKWRAFINVNRKCIKLGSFDDISEAVNARLDAEAKYWGSNK